MTEKEFEQFVRENQGTLPLYFKDYTFRTTLTTDTAGKALQKSYSAQLYNSDRCKTEKPYKPILRIEL